MRFIEQMDRNIFLKLTEERNQCMLGELSPWKCDSSYCLPGL